MSSEEAVRLKNEGSAAYSRGDFAAAVALFTAAIEKMSPETEKEALKLLYSNRSASYQSLKEYEKALEDGNKCVSLDSNWPKGYGRKGDALLALKRFGEAYNAYNAGLRISPADQTLADKAERAMRGIRSESQASSSSSATPSWIVYIRYLVLGSILLYCVPFGGFGAVFGRVGAAAFAADHIASVFQRHGRPRFENDYAVRVLPDPSTPSLLLGIFVAVSPRLYFMALVPIFLLTVMTFLGAILAYGRQHSREIEEKTFPLIRRFVPSAAPVLQSLNVAALLSDRQIPQISLVLQKLAAQAQVSQGIFLVVELLLPSRNFIQLYLWWQFLKMQYMQEQAFSGSSRPKLIEDAFVDIDKQISGLLSNRLVPQLLRTGYNTLKTYLAKQVVLPTNSPTAESRGGGLLSKCTIM